MEHSDTPHLDEYNRIVHELEMFLGSLEDDMAEADIAPDNDYRDYVEDTVSTLINEGRKAIYCIQQQINEYKDSLESKRPQDNPAYLGKDDLI